MTTRYRYANLAYYGDRRGDYKKRFLPLYGLFCKTPDGRIVGYTEDSFSMSWTSNFVRAWCRKDAEKELAAHIKDADKFRRKRGGDEGHYFLYRLTRRNGKIQTTFEPDPTKSSKYNFRNIRFKVVT